MEPEDMHSLEKHLEDTCTFDEYVTSAKIVASLQNVEEEEDDNDDDVGDKLPTVTYSQAVSAFTIIKSYLLHTSKTEAPYDLLGNLELELLKLYSNTCIQTYNITTTVQCS